MVSALPRAGPVVWGNAGVDACSLRNPRLVQEPAEFRRIRPPSDDTAELEPANLGTGGGITSGSMKFLLGGAQPPPPLTCPCAEVLSTGGPQLCSDGARVPEPTGAASWPAALPTRLGVCAPAAPQGCWGHIS